MSITVRFVTCEDFVSRAIRAGEYGFWASHVDVVMPNGYMLGAHYDGGVEERAAEYDLGIWSKQMIVTLPASLEQEQKFLDFCVLQIGKPYDLGAIGALLAGRDWKENDAWFCSELVAAALQHCGWMTGAAVEVSQITPRDLALILSARVELPVIEHSKNYKVIMPGHEPPNYGKRAPE